MELGQWLVWVSGMKQNGGMQTIGEGKSEGEASQSCQLGESRAMPQKKPLHWTLDFGRTRQEEITSAQRMEGRVGKIRGWRLNVEKKPSRENGKMQNNQCKQEALGRQENLVGLQRLRKKRGSKQSSSIGMVLCNREVHGHQYHLSASPSSPATRPSPQLNFLLSSLVTDCPYHLCSTHTYLFCNTTDIHILRYLS